MGSILIDKIINNLKKSSVSCIMLLCDTEDKKIYDFYLLRQFNPDSTYKTFNRHENLTRIL